MGGKISTLLLRNIEETIERSTKDLDFRELELKIGSEYFYSMFFLEYSKKYFNCGQQLSFILHDNTTVHAIALVYPINDQSLSYFGLPIKIFYSDSATVNAQKNIHGLCTSHLKMLSEKYKFKNMLVDLDSPLGTSYYHSGTGIKCNIDSIIDLKLTEEELKLGVRKSYKSLINWGQKNLDITIIDHKNGSIEQFDEYRNFHIRIA